MCIRDGLGGGRSGRRWIPRVAAALGVPRDARDYLGRWGAASVRSDSYVLSARQIVMGIQRDVAKWIRSGSPGYDETELHADLRRESLERGVGPDLSLLHH